MNLSKLTNKNLIVLNSDRKKKEDIIELLVDKLYREGKISSAEEFKKAVYEREQMSETGMTEGLAIPHGKSACVKEAAFAVAVTNQPVDNWESIEQDNPVQYIFLLAIPENEAGSTHLELLAELMQRMTDASYKDKLFASKTADDFLQNLDNQVSKPGSNQPYKKLILAVTACPAGIAHTYMAAEALVKAGEQMGVKVLVEKQGANGMEDRHTKKDLQEADGVIFAVDVAVKESERYKHLHSIKTSVASPIKDAKALIKKVLDICEYQKKGKYIPSSEQPDGEESVGKVIKQSIMTGISYIIPIIVAGGMIGAFAVLAANIFGLQELYNTDNTWLWMFRKLGGNLLGTVMIPVLSAYMAYSISDKTALAPGFAAGVAATLVNGGFLCGMLGGLIAGYTIKYMRKYIPAKGTLAGFVSFWVYPVGSTLIVGILMFLVIGKPVAMLNTALIDALSALGGKNAALLGAVIGIMVSFDLGGPVNKAAYAFCVGAMAEGVIMPYAVFASVKMVSGFAITFSTLLFKKYFTKEEQEVGKSTWILVLGGITEGAIPFMMADPIRVILSLCAGSAVTGALVAASNIGLDVPGAGIFSLFMLKNQPPVTAAVVWFGAAVLGAVLSAAILVYTRQRKRKKQNV